MRPTTSEPVSPSQRCSHSEANSAAKVRIRQTRRRTTMARAFSKPCTRPISRTTAERLPGPAISGNANGKTAISPGRSRFPVLASLIEDKPDLEKVRDSACRNSRTPPATCRQR